MSRSSAQVYELHQAAQPHPHLLQVIDICGFPPFWTSDVADELGLVTDLSQFERQASNGIAQVLLELR